MMSFQWAYKIEKSKVPSIGQKKAEENYIDGHGEGKSTVWHENGKKYSE